MAYRRRAPGAVRRDARGPPPVLVFGALFGVAVVGFGAWRSAGDGAPVEAAPVEPVVLAGPPLDPDRPYNVLVVTLCAVRADHLAPWGYTGSHTPTIDALARTGVVFENAWTSATYTLPSHAALLTGLLPRHVGVIGVEDTLAPTYPTLPEVLGAYGYHSVAYAPVASRASFRAGEGLERGFDTFLEGGSVHRDTKVFDAIAAAGQPYFALAHFKDAHPPYVAGREAQAPDPRMVEWVERSVAKGPADADAWFVAQMEADPALRTDVAALYDHALAKADASVGALLGGLRARGLLDHTVIVVVGDHGQALGEEGQIGHQGLLLPEVLHVPLLVHLPDDAEAGRRVADDVGVVDLAPTLLALAGATLPARLDGRSLVPLLHGDALPARGVLVQADVKGDPPVGGAQEVLVREGRWLRYVELSGVWGLRVREGDAWVDAPAGEVPTDLLEERARLSGPSVAGAARPVTESERATLRREGYW